MEKPSSAEMMATRFGLSWPSSTAACTMAPRYRLAGESTANVRRYPLAKILSSAPAPSTITWPFRSTTAAAASVEAEPYGPSRSLIPELFICSTSREATSGVDWSSWYRSASRYERSPTWTPPFRFTTSAQRS